MADKNAFLVYLDNFDSLVDLSDAEVGVLFRSLFLHERGEDPLEMTDAAKIAFRFMTKQLDLNRERYKKTCAARAEAGRKGAAIKWGKEMDQNGGAMANAIFAMPKMANVADIDIGLVLGKEREREKDPVVVFDDDGRPPPDDRTTTPLFYLLRTIEDLLSIPLQGKALQELQGFVDKLGVELVQCVVDECAANQPRSWNYIKTALSRCVDQGIDSIAAYRNRSKPGNASARAPVDRPEHSGTDILARGKSGKFRLKRKGDEVHYLP